ncbi:MAG: phosphoglucosamine mutase [Candidatus Thorarchaeota archaeon]
MTSNIFGTSGIRRVFTNYSESDVMFTPQMALEVGLALGTYIEHGTVEGGTVVIGKDIRKSATSIEHALISGLVSCGCNIKRLGIVTTPTLAMSLRVLRADAGVMITASHNTPEYIGLKFWSPNGMGFNPEQEEEIERIYNTKTFTSIEWNEVGTVSRVNDINEVHILDIIHRIMFDGSNLHVIVDPGNGSSCDIIPKLLSKYNINVTTLNCQMDGSFPGRLSEPSEENLKQISKFLKISEHDDIGIALDGDADRVIFLDENGDIVDPIRLLALMAKDYLERYKGSKIKQEMMKVVTPINSSSLIEEVLTPLGCEVVRCEVGDIKVAMCLKENNAFLGGENSGTYIWPSTHLGPDSIATIAKVLRIIAESGKGLCELLENIPKYPFYRTNHRLKKDIPFTDGINKQITDEMKDIFNELGKKIEKINQMDGIRIDYEDGWILIRRSGTSPYLRISGESSIDMSASIEINKIATEKMKKLDLI